MLQTLRTRSVGARTETPAPVPESGEGLPVPGTRASRSDFHWLGVLAAFSHPASPHRKRVSVSNGNRVPRGCDGAPQPEVCDE